MEELIQNKLKFVESISKAFENNNLTIVNKIYYHAFYNKADHLQEFIVVEYKDGTFSARNCCRTDVLYLFHEISDAITMSKELGERVYDWYIEELDDSIASGRGLLFNK